MRVKYGGHAPLLYEIFGTLLSLCPRSIRRIRLLLITNTKNLKTVCRVASRRVYVRRVDTFLHYVIQLRGGRIFHSEISSVRSAHLSQFPFQKGILHYVFQRSVGDATSDGAAASRRRRKRRRRVPQSRCQSVDCNDMPLLR